MKMRTLLAAIALVATAASQAVAEEAMTGAEMTALLSGGKTIMLGGPGTGYSGELALNADGTGKGKAATDDGSKTFMIEGTWEIRDDTFCRIWAEISDGEEVCETWVLVEPKKVKVMNGDKEIGTNFWD